MPRHPDAATTTDRLERRVFDALAARAARHDGPLFRLNVGDTWRDPPAAARVENLRGEDVPRLHAYAPPHGEPSLLRAVLERLASRCRSAGRPVVQRGDLLVTAGATGGLSAACQALLDPGDEVLLPSPFWPLIRGLVASRGAVPVEVPCLTRLGEAGFDLEAALESAVSARTAAVYLNTPHNPTGAVLGENDLDAVARVAERHDLWILADEVYEDLWLAEPPAAAAWLRADMAPRTVSAHSASKAWALAGARVGWVHGPRGAMERVRAVATHQVYCAAKPMQHAALHALAAGPEWLSETRRLHEAAARQAAGAVGVPTPRSGTFLFFDASPWLPAGGDALPFLERCLDAGVLLTPGSACGAHFDRWVRLCFTCLPPAELGEALGRLASVIGTG